MGQIELKEALDRPSLALLAILLLLRFPVLIAGSSLLDSDFIMAVYLDGSYLCTALLIIRQRHKLSLSNITAEAVWLIVALPFVSALVHFTFYTAVTGSSGYWSPVQMLTAAGLAYCLHRKGDARLIRQEPHRLAVWTVLTLVLAIGATLLYNLRYAGLPPVATPTTGTLGALCLYQMSTAALAEEPLFRGFLWGWLRRLRCSDLVICLFQAALFWAGHIYYFFSAPYSFWVLVPTAALLLGIIAWRGRSIFYTMLAHAVLNGLGELLRFYL